MYFDNKTKTYQLDLQVWFHKIVCINRETKILEIYAKICRFARRIFEASNFQWPLRLRVQNCLLHNVFGLRSEKIIKSGKNINFNLKIFYKFQFKIKKVNEKYVHEGKIVQESLIFL